MELQYIELSDQEMDEYLSVALAETFSKPGTADVTPSDRFKLRNLMKYYAGKAHPFTACKADQMKHGVPEEHANRRCAVMKDLITGTTKWRKGGKANLSEEEMADLAVRAPGELLDYLSTLGSDELLKLVGGIDDTNDARLSEGSGGRLQQESHNANAQDTQIPGGRVSMETGYRIDFALSVGDVVEWGEDAKAKAYGQINEIDEVNQQASIKPLTLNPDGTLTRTGDHVLMKDLDVISPSDKKVPENKAWPDKTQEVKITDTSIEWPEKATENAVLGLWLARDTGAGVKPTTIDLANGETPKPEQIEELSEFFDKVDDGMGGFDCSWADYQMHGGDAAREWVDEAFDFGIFNELLHPRGDHGKFALKGDGSSKKIAGGFKLQTHEKGDAAVTGKHPNFGKTTFGHVKAADGGYKHSSKERGTSSETFGSPEAAAHDLLQKQGWLDSKGKRVKTGRDQISQGPIAGGSGGGSKAAGGGQIGRAASMSDFAGGGGYNFSPGNRVQWKDNKGEVATGTVLKVIGDSCVVNVDGGGQATVPHSSLSRKSSSDSPSNSGTDFALPSIDLASSSSSSSTPKTNLNFTEDQMASAMKASGLEDNNANRSAVMDGLAKSVDSGTIGPPDGLSLEDRGNGREAVAQLVEAAGGEVERKDLGDGKMAPVGVSKPPPSTGSSSSNGSSGSGSSGTGSGTGSSSKGSGTGSTGSGTGSKGSGGTGGGTGSSGSGAGTGTGASKGTGTGKGKAAAGSGSGSTDSSHPHAPAGQPNGGQFVSKDDSGNTTGSADVDQTLTDALDGLDPELDTPEHRAALADAITGAFNGDMAKSQGAIDGLPENLKKDGVEAVGKALEGMGYKVNRDESGAPTSVVKPSAKATINTSIVDLATSNFAVGDKVSFTDEDGNTVTGVIEEINDEGEDDGPEAVIELDSGEEVTVGTDKLTKVSGGGAANSSSSPSDSGNLSDNPFAGLAPAAQMPVDLSEAKQVGGNLWRKHILPYGKINHKGRILDFSKKFAKQLVSSFKQKPFDQVPFFKVDADNQHNSDPDNFRGEVKGLELGDDGVYALVETNQKGTEYLKNDNPKLGTSVRVRFDYTRNADNKRFGPVLEHLAGTTLPHVPGLKPFAPADMTLVDMSEQRESSTHAGGVEDLTACSFEKDTSVSSQKGGDPVADDKNNDNNKEVNDLADGNEGTPEETPEGTFEGIDLSEFPEEQRPAIQAVIDREKKSADLAAQLHDAWVNERQARHTERVQSYVSERVKAGVKPVVAKSAEAILMDMTLGEKELTIDLSEDGSGEQTVDVHGLVRQIMDNFPTEMKYGQDGADDLSAEPTSDDDLLAVWDQYQAEQNGTPAATAKGGE